MWAGGLPDFFSCDRTCGRESGSAPPPPPGAQSLFHSGSAGSLLSRQPHLPPCLSRQNGEILGGELPSLLGVPPREWRRKPATCGRLAPLVLAAPAIDDTEEEHTCNPLRYNVEAKTHTQIFIKAKRCYNSSFAYIFCVHGYLQIAFPEIHFTEDGAAGHPRGDVHHVGQGVCIWDGDEIQPAIFAARALAAIRFSDHLGRGPWTVRPPDDGVSLQLIKFRLGGGELLRI
jgi:hypothetical protein